VAACFLNCGKHHDPDTPATAGRDIAPLRPQPPGSPIGNGDSLIQSIKPRLTPWVAMWKQALPGFAAESLFRIGEAPAFRGGVTQPLRNVYPPTDENQNVVFHVLGEDSPDGRHRLIFDCYQYVGDDAGEIETGGDVDSAPLLLDRSRGTSTQFDFCGPLCGFDWGAWISSKAFVLGGSAGDDAGGPWRQGSLKIYSLHDSTVVTYVTRFASSEETARYRSAWRSWLAPRYRAAMKHRPG